MEEEEQRKKLRDKKIETTSLIVPAHEEVYSGLQKTNSFKITQCLLLKSFIFLLIFHISGGNLK